jgi:catalase
VRQTEHTSAGIWNRVLTFQFCPGHVVRGIDFTDDPLLQGRLFSYVDTHLHRSLGSPNFEHIPINRPHVPIHNNHRDGSNQYYIHTNNNAYVENSLSGGAPYAANQTVNNGFFTAPERYIPSAKYLREVSPTFKDFYTQPRLFFNSLPAAEQQMVINAARFELANIQSDQVRRNAITQFNLISNDLANRVGAAFGYPKLEPDSKYYHNNKTEGVSTFGRGPLPTVVGLKVGILATSTNGDSLASAKQISEALKAKGLNPIIIAEILADGVGSTYSNADGVLYDAVVAANNIECVFTEVSSLFPANRPNEIYRDAFNYGKPIGAIGHCKACQSIAADNQPGVYYVNDVGDLANKIEEGLKIFKFTDRFPLDQQ